MKSTSLDLTETPSKYDFFPVVICVGYVLDGLRKQEYNARFHSVQLFTTPLVEVLYDTIPGS